MPPSRSWSVKKPAKMKAPALARRARPARPVVPARRARIPIRPTIRKVQVKPTWQHRGVRHGPRAAAAAPAALVVLAPPPPPLRAKVAPPLPPPRKAAAKKPAAVSLLIPIAASPAVPVRVTKTPDLIAGGFASDSDSSSSSSSDSDGYKDAFDGSTSPRVTVLSHRPLLPSTMRRYAAGDARGDPGERRGYGDGVLDPMPAGGKGKTRTDYGPGSL